MIELKPGAQASLPRKLIPLSQAKLKELQKFISEHLNTEPFDHRKAPTQHHSSSSRRKMENYDQYKTINR
jgi:hypothetical protein